MVLLQQVQLKHGGLVTLLVAPHAEALRWLHRSRLAGFSSASSTALSLERSWLNLVWLRGWREEADELWGLCTGSPAFLGCWRLTRTLLSVSLVLLVVSSLRYRFVMCCRTRPQIAPVDAWGTVVALWPLG